MGEEGGMPLIWIRQAEYKIEANYYHTDTGLKFMSGNPPSPLKRVISGWEVGIEGRGGVLWVLECVVFSADHFY